MAELYRLPNEIVMDGMTLPGDHITPANITRVSKMEPRQGDVLVASYPRSGSTWMIEAVSLILNNGSIDAVSSKPQYSRAPYLEHAPARKDSTAYDFITEAENIQASEGRLLKTHVPFKYVSNLVCNDLVKTIVVMRNPKDMLVSLFHFYKTNKVLGWFDRSWDDFFELFKQKKLVYGDWLDHVSGFWENCAEMTNVLFIKYEDAKDDIRSTLERIATFLNKKFDKETFDNMMDHVSFVKMKNNPMTNLKELSEVGFFKDDKFIRQGMVGSWKAYFTGEQETYVEEIYVKAITQLGLAFRDM